MRPIYLDCAATTPLDPAVAAVVRLYQEEEFGNSGSRTHDYGARAKQAVQKARDQVAGVVSASRDDVVLTSGATEANNIAIMGLREFGLAEKRHHILCSAIEHKAVLEPAAFMGSTGFQAEVIPVDATGRLNPDSLVKALRPETLLVSVMHVNNETGVVQPIDDLCAALKGHGAYLHVDTSQGFGKDLAALRNQRIDLISVSGHKIYGPKGVGALVMRKRRFERPPLKPLMFGGGQERGLRPGTLPVALVAGLGEASERALAEHGRRSKRVVELQAQAVRALAAVGAIANGAEAHRLPHFYNFSVPGTDSEAVMVALKDLVAVSSGSACTSTSYTGSYVLKAMGLDEDRVRSAIRLSWCHLTPDVPWTDVVARIDSLRGAGSPKRA
jgi:cysteine desulfurase